MRHGVVQTGIRTHQRPIDQRAQTCYIWDTAIAVLAPEAVNKMLRRNIADVCSLGSDKGLPISCMTGGISATKPEMLLRRQDLVLFYSLPIDALVSAYQVMPNTLLYAPNLRSDITDSSEIFLRLDIVATSSVTDVVLQRFTTR